MGPQRRLFLTAQPVDLVCAVEPKNFGLLANMCRPGPPPARIAGGHAASRSGTARWRPPPQPPHSLAALHAPPRADPSAPPSANASLVSDHDDGRWIRDKRLATPPRAPPSASLAHHPALAETQAGATRETIESVRAPPAASRQQTAAAYKIRNERGRINGRTTNLHLGMKRIVASQPGAQEPGLSRQRQRTWT